MQKLLVRSLFLVILFSAVESWALPDSLGAVATNTLGTTAKVSIPLPMVLNTSVNGRMTYGTGTTRGVEL